MRSVDDLVAELDQLQMRDLERPHGAQRHLDRLVAIPPLRRTQLPADLSQGAEDRRPVETLPFAMLAVIHDLPSISYSPRAAIEPFSLFAAP